MRYFLMFLIIALSGCAASRQVQHEQPTAHVNSIVELRRGPPCECKEGERQYVWLGRTWTMTDLRSGIAEKAKKHPITEIRMLDADTVGEAIDAYSLMIEFSAKGSIWNSELNKFGEIIIAPGKPGE